MTFLISGSTKTCHKWNITYFSVWEFAGVNLRVNVSVNGHLPPCMTLNGRPGCGPLGLEDQKETLFRKSVCSYSVQS